jgi:hypothetical protein
MKQRSDVKLSTLRRYVKALGGAAEVQVVVNGRKFVLELEAADLEPARKLRR